MFLEATQRLNWSCCWLALKRHAYNTGNQFYVAAGANTWRMHPLMFMHMISECSTWCQMWLFMESTCKTESKGWVFPEGWCEGRERERERERELYLAGGVQKGWQPVAQSPEKQTSSHEWSQWWPYLAAVEAAVAFVAGPLLLSRRSFFLLHHHSCHQFSSHSLISPFLVHPGRDQRVELQAWRHWGKHCSTTAIACTPMPSWVPAAAASSSSPAAAAAVVADVGGDWLALPPPGGWRHRPSPLPPKGSAALPSSLSLVPWF
jgi:hypothetical protein